MTMISSTASRVIARSALWLALSAALAIGCGDADPPAQGGDSEVEATETIDDVSDATSGELDAGVEEDTSDAMSDASGVEADDILSQFPSDLPIITDIDEDVDLSEYFPDADASGPLPEVEDVSVDPEGDASAEDAGEALSDTSDGESSEDAAEDSLDEPDTFLADCENLGVSPNWEGAFDGAIEYHIPEALEDLFYPTDGILIVGGSLSFDISCVDSKLIVSGDMDGTANVSGEGDFPFSVGLAGYFNPETGLLNANLVDGMVVLYGLAEIYFSGDFVGTLTDEIFDGTWSASYDGTNFPLPPGDVPEAEGLGTWSAQAAEVD